MAIDLTSGTQPAFASISTLTTTCVQIRAVPHTRIAIKAATDLYIFNGVADGGAAPAAASRIALTAAEAAQVPIFTVGGAVDDTRYGTICVAAQSGSSLTLEAWSIPPERGAP